MRRGLWRVPARSLPGRAPLRVGRRKHLRGRALGLPLALLLGMPAWGQEPSGNLGDKSLEDLMNIEVNSVSKKEQKLSRTASAIFVITQEDIRRSGATNIPDLLRMVPGLDVAQVNSNSWAISSRGFNDELANKLLVLIDGRSVYSPLTGGVFWDSQQIPLVLIERIEVIRGPGAAVWGANAVNGVINITTKKASDTQGELLTGGGGTYDEGLGTAVFGDKIGGDTFYRAFFNGSATNHLIGLTSENGLDEWNTLRTGFRVDSKLDAANSLTIQGDAYNGSEGEVLTSLTSLQPPQPQTQDLQGTFSGWDVVARWNHSNSATSDLSLQVYFDRTDRADATEGQGINTFDIDFQEHAAWGSRQDIVWGLGYRVSADDIRGTIRVSFDPPSEADQLFSSFLQDEIAIVPDRVYFTAGVKLEHNHFSGFGVQPDARIAWLANDKNTFWAAISRALRTPDRIAEVRFNETVFPGPGGLPVLVSSFGNPRQENEVLRAEEFGYRAQLAKHVSLDLTAFYNSYSHLESNETGTPFLESSPPPEHLVQPINSANLLYGETHGAELAMNWKPTARWTISPGYTYLQVHIYRSAASNDTSTAPSINGKSPREQAQLRSHLELSPHWEWDASAYFVGRLPAEQLPSYTRLDTGLTWHLSKKLSFRVVGQNLLRQLHVEFDDSEDGTAVSEVKRSVYAQFTREF
jgi:iron complex outermembrane recepter protein